MPSETNIANASAPSRWGTIGTAAWTIVLVVIFVVAQSTAILVALQLDTPDVPLSEIDVMAIESNGRLFALGAIGTSIVVIPGLLIVAKLKRGSNLKDYFALKTVPLKTIVFWIVAALLLALASDGLKFVLGIPIAIDFVVDTYQTMGNAAVFLLGISVLAPLTEELFCRGFMISGLKRGPLKAAGAVVVTSILWASIHFQYELFDIVVIFTLGCLFGASRIITGSIYPAIAAHMSINAASYLLTGLYIENYST